jgi:hypothetical protein
MANRLLIGLHPGFGQFGAWLSKPGVDVVALGPGSPSSQFILKPDLKYEQVVLSGTIGLGAASLTTVVLPIDMGRHPYIYMKGNVNPATEYPSNLGAAGQGGSGNPEVSFVLSVFTDHFLVQNNNAAAGIFLFFMVFSRSIGA